MVSQQPAVRAKEGNAAVERPASALDHADHEMNLVPGSDLAKPIRRWTGDFYGALPVPPVEFVASRCPRAHHRAKRHVLRLPRDEGFGEHDQLGAIAGRLTGTFGPPIKRRFPIEYDGGVLNDCCVNAPRATAFLHSLIGRSSADGDRQETEDQRMRPLGRRARLRDK